MKKLVCLAMALLCVLFLFVSCNTTEKSANEKLKIAVVPKSLDNPIFDEVHTAAQQKADELGVDLIWTASETSDYAAQVAVVEDLIKQKVDGILLSCNDPDALADVINRAVSAGIVVGCFDADSPGSSRAFHIGTDNAELGRTAAKQMNSLMPGGGNIAILTGVPGAQNLEERAAAFEEELLSADGWNLYPTIYCDDDIALAVEQVNTFTAETPDLDAWFFVGGWPLNVETDENKELVKFSADGNIIVSIDASPHMLSYLQNGTVATLIGQGYAEMGSVGVQTLYGLLTGDNATSEHIAESQGILFTKTVVLTRDTDDDREESANNTTESNTDSSAPIPSQEDAPESTSSLDEPDQQVITLPADAVKTEIEIEDAIITMYLAANWTFVDKSILTDNRVVADFHSVTLEKDKEKFFEDMDEKHADAKYARDVEMDGIEGKYYGYQFEIPELTAMNNELLYYLYIDEYVIALTFYPAVGLGGISNQCRNFEVYLRTIQVSA
jgi:ribose transport system substrate-binding protein